MSAFTARPRTRLFAAATVALAALSLTACNDKLGVQDEGAAQTSTTAPTSTQAPEKTGGTGQTGGSTAGNSTSGNSSTGGDNGSGGSTGSNGGKSSGGKTSGGSGSNSGANSGSNTSASSVPCSGANTKVTAQSVSRPINHMLLTVTNTGTKTCDLYYYPALNFDDAQSVPPVMKESQPQAVTTLTPGESGYAAVALAGGDNGSGTNGHTAKSLAVYFFDRNSNSISPAATPSLPAKGVYVDDSLRVTYWLSDAQDALTY
ncbi:DUF4232 domain-containing protein [Streptomyces sp. NBC_01239]|uniref:DUF4232 domain-containing protein n=1 Tax=Streptomyces sp. NBC_01239 TaxID=2903792 RepID=UPI00224F431D|nr:DUF4232 domain-containing protein [Streptomyces sp. NBC_01239]MCX4812005.1 DUF4232 domain-containing protein [Streptomyces sp. NBC_01239]